MGTVNTVYVKGMAS